MDINLGSGFNKMNSLSFHWTAGFKDGSDVMQFNEDGTENRFQIVKDRFNELNNFYLYNKDCSKLFIVNLEKGIISLGKIQEIHPEILKEEKTNIRLIYFRRIRKQFSENMVLLNTIIIYFLGFQYIDKHGNNRQIILQIDEHGNFILGD